MVNKQGDLGRNPPTCYSPGLCQQIAAFFPGGKASVLLRKLPVMGLHGAVSEWPLGLAASGYHGDSGQPHREPLLTFLPPRPPAPLHRHPQRFRLLPNREARCTESFRRAPPVHPLMGLLI